MRNSIPVATLAILVLAGSASAGEVTVGAGASLDAGSATLDLGEGDLTIAGAVSAGSAAVTGVRHLTISSGGVLNGETATIQLCGDWSNSGSFNAGSGNVEFVDGCVSVATLSGSTTFAGLSMTTSTGKQFDFTSGATQTVAGPLVLQGASGNLLVLRSTTGGSEGFVSATGSTTTSFVDVDDVHASGDPIALGQGSTRGSNSDGFFLSQLIPLLTPLGLVLLVLGLAWSGRNALVSGRRSPAP